MEHLIEFRETLLEFRNPDNGWRDTRRMNGNEGPGPLLIKGRRELLKRLLKLQEEIGLTLITPEESLLVQQMWKAARDPDDGRGVARIVNKQRGVVMNTDLNQLNRLREMEEEVAR
jgi:DNA sulfur modification protein DndC